VLAASLVLAILVYRVAVATYEPTLEELLPDSSAVIERQRGILFGRTGAVLFRWWEAAQRPAGLAILVIAAGVIGAAVFYQAAHRIEIDEG
jgi:hypothetical protein